MKDTTTLSRASAILISAVLIATVLRYVFNISMAWLLSPNEYGILGIAQAIAVMLSVFLGAAFPYTAAKFISEPEQRRNAFKSALLGNLIFALSLCALLYAIYALGALRLGREYQPVLFAIMALVVIGSIGGVYQGVLQGLFRFKPLRVIRIVDMLVVVVFAVLLVVLGFGPLGAILGFVASAVICTLLGVYFTRGDESLSRGSWIDKEVYAYALPMLLGGISVYLLMCIDILGVKFFIDGNSDVMAGYYQASLVLARLPIFLMAGAVIEAFFPFISYYSLEKERVERYVAKLNKYVFIFILPLSLILFALSRQIIGLFYPEAYVAAASALSILSIGMFFLVLTLILARTFQAVNRPKIPALILSGAIVLQIVLLYFLVPRYGLAGAAISTTIASMAGFIVLFFQYIRYYKSGFKVTGLLKVALSTIVLLVLLYIFPASNQLLLILGIALGLIAFLIILAGLRFLDHRDAETLLSGMFSNEDRFKARIVGLIKALNRA